MIRLAKAQTGVTLVELLIATSVFAVVLLIIMAAFLFVSNDYIKGYIESQTQETSRSIIEELTQDIQLNNGAVYQLAPSGSTYGICVGNHRYSYSFNQQVGSGTGLVLDNDPGCNAVSVPQSGALSSTSKQLLGDHMRLGAFSVTNTNGMAGEYTINLTIGYGDDDVLTTTQSTAPFTYTCPQISLSGDFCATSTLQATVQQRVTSNGE